LVLASRKATWANFETRSPPGPAGPVPYRRRISRLLTADCQEHEELALGQAQLADVDVDVANPGLGKALALRGLLLALGQAGDAVAHEASVQGAARELGDRLPQAAQHVIERQKGTPPELYNDCLLGLGQDISCAAGMVLSADRRL
jgi:hypothetical protein